MDTFFAGNKSKTDSYDDVALKAQRVREGLEQRNIKLRDGSALWQLLRQADILSQAWAEGVKPENKVVWETLHVNRLANAVINLLDEPGIQEALTRMARNPMQPDDRSVSQGKDALWELDLMSQLKDRGLPVRAEEPDILVDIGFGDYPIACKKSWSKCGLEKQISKAAKQLAPFNNGGLIAINLDDLVVSGGGVVVPTKEHAMVGLSRAQAALIGGVEYLLEKAVIEGKCDGFIISTTVYAKLTEEKIQPYLASLLSFWSKKAPPAACERFLAFFHSVAN
ncbi:hypothetical protein [Pseudomonas sp. XWY-1]|uniref:hypothetical protein n=1 Tax=Pseudomonas sp. XWY-1 TaxID=2069256 RepID=UPI000CF4C7DC|nr:hypothetical protein [Pseudomonas sp. XWY-1]